MSLTANLKKTPLYNRHISLDARMVPFGGWLMPLQYSGIIDEHLHTRGKAAIFDTCHMGELFFKGAKAEAELEKLFTCNMKTLAKGRCRYGFMLNKSGGVIDDLIVFKISDDEFMVVVNAGTLDKDKEWIASHIDQTGIRLTDNSEEIAKIDIQGPLSKKIVSELFPGYGFESLKRFNFQITKIKELNDSEVTVSATGYTGEDGFEFFVRGEYGGMLWDKFLSNDSVNPAGLGSRDSLRLEKGYSLYGHDLDEEHTPFECGLMQFVSMDKYFIGKDIIEKQEDKNGGLVRSGFICEGRRSAREGYALFSKNKECGLVTSGVFSPCLKKGVGLCYIDRRLNIKGKDIVISDGKVEIKAVLAEPPFV